MPNPLNPSQTSSDHDAMEAKWRLISAIMGGVVEMLRPAPGKDRAIILDHAGNSLAHGLPDDPRAWSLDDKPRREREGRPAKPRLCPECQVVNRPGALTCKGCGVPLAPTPEEQREIDAALVLADRAELSRSLRAMRYAEAVVWADTEDKLRQVAKARGFHHKWVSHRLHEMRQGVEA